ncbi:MAG: formate dehydrogenase accessory protein FdhE [Nitrospirae bacterium]|nr:formate dehydrogenase accessory protein FdhE [Nitrospirota bacterium]
MVNHVILSEDILIEAEKRGVKDLLEHYYYFLDAMKAADIPSFNISSSELQDATEGIKKGRYVLKTVKLPFDLHGKEDAFRKAFLINLAKGLNGFEDVVNKHWENSFCPVCGSLPSLGVLGGDREGGMSLVCSLCETQWDFRRLYCPFCGNDNQEWLGYLYSETDEGYRVNYCNKCKLYLKIVDIRKKGNVYSYPIEDIITLPLDILAQEHGYKRLAPNPLGMVMVK